MSDIPNIHDKFIRNILETEENSRAFLKTALPADISGLIDYSQLKIDKTNHIHQNFKEYFSDLIVKTGIKDQECDIYFLIEHKSYHPDSRMLFLQILQYLFSSWEQDLQDSKPFRVILPLVLYHGKRDWSIPFNFNEIIDAPGEIKKYLLDFTYILYNTKELDKHSPQLKKNIILLTSLVALKTAFDKDQKKGIKEVIHLLHEHGLLSQIDTIIIIIIIFLEPAR